MRITPAKCMLTIAVISGWLCAAFAFAAEASSRPVFEDEPAARALYDKMIAAMRQARTLSYRSDYMWEAQGRIIGRARYTIWMKKPNHFRLETMSRRDPKRTGIIVGDGEFLWLYWPSGVRPRFYPADEDAEAYEKTKSNVYMKKSTPLGRHSIGHEVVFLGAGMFMTVLDPSTFHGYTDSLQKYIDGVRSLPAEKVGDESCNVIEVSIMKGQRSWYLWLSKRDHLPRKLKEVVRVSYDIVTHERWSEVTVNAEIPDEKFSWKPPAGWKQWRLPGADERLLKPGTKAPDFELPSADGKKIRLSNYRDKVVWLYIWRGG